MIVACDNGSERKDLCKIHEDLWSLNNLTVSCFNKNLQKSDINDCRLRQMARNEKICVRFMKIYGPSTKSIRI